MTKPTDDQLAKLGDAFDAFARRYKLADSGGVERSLNEIDKYALRFVADHPGSGPTDLARHLGVPVTTASSATDRLARRGLLQRDRVEDDRRAVALRLSPEGEALVAELVAAYRALCRMMLERLSPAERDSFIGMIGKIVYHDD